MIVRFGETKVAKATDLITALGQTEPEQTLAVGVARGDEKLEVQVKLDRRPLEIIRPELDSKPVDVADGDHDPLSLSLSSCRSTTAS